MDRRIIEALAGAGIDTTFEKAFPSIGIEADEKDEPKPVGAQVMVIEGEKVVAVELQPIPALLVGAKQPPSFQEGPTPEYVPFFILIESMVVNYCVCTKKGEYDEEIARLYNLLRRRPDGSDSNPLFGYLQATVRLYLSLRDGSRAELEAVLNRLTRSAKRFAEGAASTNYQRILSEHLQAG